MTLFMIQDSTVRLQDVNQTLLTPTLVKQMPQLPNKSRNNCKATRKALKTSCTARQRPHGVST